MLGVLIVDSIGYILRNFDIMGKNETNPIYLDDANAAFVPEKKSRTFCIEVRLLYTGAFDGVFSSIGSIASFLCCLPLCDWRYPYGPHRVTWSVFTKRVAMARSLPRQSYMHYSNGIRRSR